MKALHIVTAYPRFEGDVITPWLTATLGALRGKGIEVDVLAPAYRGGGDQVVGGVPVFRFRYAPARLERLTHEETTPDRLARHPTYAALLPGYVVAGSARALHLQRGRGYDVVHVHWAVPHGLMGWAARSSGRPALVTTFYGAELRWAESAFPPARAFLKAYCRRDTLIAISSATRSALARYTQRPVHVVPYPAAFPLDAASRRGPVAPADDLPRVLFVGRLVERKGVANLLRAAAASSTPFNVQIVGFGPEEQRLRRLTAELGLEGRVDFAGRVSSDELARKYAAAAAFVLPATVDARGDTEGLGVVLLEAMAHGVPVVATRRGGILDVVRDGETGLLVEDGDVTALSAAITRVLTERGLAERLAAAGADHVRGAFSAESVAGRLAEIYERAVAGDESAESDGGRSGMEAGAAERLDERGRRPAEGGAVRPRSDQTARRSEAASVRRAP